MRRRITIENAVACVVYPACSKLKITRPIVSVPLDHSKEETVNSVKAVRKTKKAPLINPGKISGIRILFHFVNKEAPLVLAACSIDTSICRSDVTLPRTCKIRNLVKYAIYIIQTDPYIPGFHPGIGSIHVKIRARASTVPGRAYGMAIMISIVFVKSVGFLTRK